MKDETLERLREIAKRTKMSQGEVVDRILEGGFGMNQTVSEEVKADFVGATVDRFRYEDFRLSELAIDVIASMLGLNSNNRRNEEKKDNPDLEMLIELQEDRKRLLSERDLIYSGNKDVMRACIEKYGPVIKAYYSKTD